MIDNISQKPKGGEFSETKGGESKKERIEATLRTKSFFKGHQR